MLADSVPSSPPDRSPRVALVTGAARRIGRAIAQRLSGAGCAIALHASERSAQQAEALAESLRQSGGRAAVVVGDLADSRSTARAFELAIAAVGGIDLLVNNASLFEPDAATAFDLAVWEKHFSVNLRAPAQLAALFAKALPAGQRGSIVNVIDQRVWRLNPQFFSYTLSKSALWTATQTMAQAFAPRIRVNAIGPGPVLPSVSQGNDDFLREAQAIPLQRQVTPEDIAEAVLYLARAESVTGQMIAVDGGQHLSWQTPDVTG